MSKLDKKESDEVFRLTMGNLTNKDSEDLCKQIDEILKNFSIDKSVHPTGTSLMIMTTWIDRIQVIHTKDVALDIIVELIKIVIDDPTEFLDRYIPQIEDKLIKSGRVQFVKSNNGVMH